MNDLRRIVTILLLTSLAAAPAAATGATTADATGAERPRVGLVLGGGGAKGAAHIGVLRILDEMNIPVDCVVGTSMGALVGAPFAAGMPSARIEEIVRSTDWSRTVGGSGLRRRTPISRKLAERNYTNSVELGVSLQGVTTPGGLLSTQYIEDMIRALVSRSGLASTAFDDLAIPFRAIATDMVAGEMVVLDSGDLPVALRASMAVPGVFAPVKLDGQVLSDGGMMRNLPVDIARDVCADVVIAVWFAAPSPEPGELGSAVSIVGRALDVMVNANQKEQIASLGERDVGIEVDLDDISAADFHRVPDAIDLGRDAAERMRAALARYSVSRPLYARWRESLSRAEGDAVTLAEVSIEGLERVAPPYVEAQLRHTAPGATVTRDQIVEDTDRIFALGDFERVTYAVEGPRDGKILTIYPEEKSWGPGFLRFDLGLTANELDELEAVLRADYRRTWLNPRGGEWHGAVQIGRQTLLETDFYQPLDVQQRYFVQPIVRLATDLQDAYLGDDRIATYQLQEGWAQVDFGMNIDTRAQLRAGLRRGTLDVELDTGIIFLPTIDDLAETALVLGGVYDTRDAIALPTRGTLATVRYLHAGSWLGGDARYEQIEAVYSHAYDWRGDSLSITLGAGATLAGESPPNRQFRLGGIRTFPGLRPGELRGDGYWFAGTSYYWRIADISPVFGQSLYAGLRMQVARAERRLDGLDEETVYGLAGSLVGRTPIGPVLFSGAVLSRLHGYRAMAAAAQHRPAPLRRLAARRDQLTPAASDRPRGTGTDCGKPRCSRQRGQR
ncbi:MAG: patatin-like phospholipase family protein [Gammaproteobacteria bacterium]